MNDPTSSSAASTPPNASKANPTLRIVSIVLWVLVVVGGVYLVWSWSRLNESLTGNNNTSGNQPGDPQPISIAELENDDGTNSSHDFPNDEPQEVTSAGWDPNGIADFKFQERSGRTITKEDLLGKHWLVCFVFTRCAGPCQDVTKQMYELQDALLDRDVRLVTITVDPEYDTPERLTSYADVFAADEEKWLYLTGDKDETYRLIRDSFKMPVKEMFGEARKPGWEVLHSSNILHVDDKGVVQAKYNAVIKAEVHQLIKDIQAAVPLIGDESAEEGQPEEGDTEPAGDSELSEPNSVEPNSIETDPADTVPAEIPPVDTSQQSPAETE